MTSILKSDTRSCGEDDGGGSCDHRAVKADRNSQVELSFTCEVPVVQEKQINAPKIVV